MLFPTILKHPLCYCVVTVAQFSYHHARYYSQFREVSHEVKNAAESSIVVPVFTAADCNVGKETKWYQSKTAWYHLHLLVLRKEALIRASTENPVKTTRWATLLYGASVLKILNNVPSKLEQRTSIFPHFTCYYGILALQFFSLFLARKWHLSFCMGTYKKNLIARPTSCRIALD